MPNLRVYRFLPQEEEDFRPLMASENTLCPNIKGVVAIEQTKYQLSVTVCCLLVAHFQHCRRESK
jgi:hypothetical protein